MSPCSLQTHWVFSPAAGAGKRVGADALLEGGLARQGGLGQGETHPTSCRSAALPGGCLWHSQLQKPGCARTQESLRLMHLASSTWVVPRPPRACTAPVIPEAAREVVLGRSPKPESA